MWEISNTLQILGFFRSALFGCFFCFFYDVLRAHRKVYSPSDFKVFVQDMAYFLICAPVTFCLFLSITNGELRLYVFAGIITGFALMRLTLSRLFFFILVKIFDFLKGVFKSITDLLNRFFSFFDGLIGGISAFFCIFFRKAVNSLKKLLKKQ